MRVPQLSDLVLLPLASWSQSWNFSLSLHSGHRCSEVIPVWPPHYHPSQPGHPWQGGTACEPGGPQVFPLMAPLEHPCNTRVPLCG